MKSAIEWCDETWEVTAGCTKVSPGCDNCYACRMSATRLKHHPDYGGGLAFGQGEPCHTEYDWTGEVRLLPHNLDKPLHWQKPRRVFVNSRSDLFHESVPFEFFCRVLDTIRDCPQHSFIILTKRADRMEEYFKRAYRENRPYPNLWLLVSVENQEQADLRIPHLLRTPAAVRGVSIEPMLGEIILMPAVNSLTCPVRETCITRLSRGCTFRPPQKPCRSWPRDVRLDWAICGGESGPDARSMHPDWARRARDDCKAAGVPFYLKQMHVDGKLVKMPELDGVVYDQYPAIREEDLE